MSHKPWAWWRVLPASNLRSTWIFQRALNKTRPQMTSGDTSSISREFSRHGVCLSFRNDSELPKWELDGGNSNIFDFHPYLGNDPNWRAYFSNGLKPPTRECRVFCTSLQQAQSLDKLKYICQPLFLPVVPHEAVSEVSKGKVHINQKKNVPIRIVYDMFEHFDFFFDILHPNYHQNKYTVTEV